VSARIVVLASGSGSNLQAVLDACAQGTLDATVELVVVNRAGAGAIERARRAGVDVVESLLGDRSPQGRRDYDADLAEIVGAAGPDWVVLAGWMHILSMSFLGAFANRVVNLHPALPGEFTGVDAIRRAWEAGRTGTLTRTGVMVHLVPDEGVDDGPVLATAEVPLVPGESLDALTERVHAVEHRLLVDTLADLVAGGGQGDVGV
jgi:formyltetrahydrofolate-dependent phosphoribosylglycinamide formyltransferase